MTRGTCEGNKKSFSVHRDGVYLLRAETCELLVFRKLIYAHSRLPTRSVFDEAKDETHENQTKAC